MKALIFVDGLHPPWTKGEAVSARNLILILAKLYDSVEIISNFEKSRLSNNTNCEVKICQKKVLDYIPNNSRIIFLNDNKKTYDLLKRGIYEPNCHIHLLHKIELQYMFLIFRKKVFFYNFSYKTFGKLNLKFNALPAVACISKISNFTTSIKDYKKFSRVFKRNYFYVPVPILINTSNSTRRYCLQGPLKVLYIGHPSYKRFPYREIFAAIKKLEKDGCELILDIYFSTVQGKFFDHRSFYTELSLAKFIDNKIKIRFKNLKTEEKNQILLNHDLLLYPATDEVAMDPPLIVLEAMGAGCCVVSTRVQSCELLLKPDKGILISKMRLKDEIYSSILLLSKNRDLINFYGNNAMEYVKTIHNFDICRNILRSKIFDY